MNPHKNAHNDLSATYVKKILAYEPATGLFRWKIRLSIRAPIGNIAGRKQNNGRIKIGIAGKEYAAHRLAWLIMTGHWPKYEVDHKNENQSDNSWKNLRDVTPSQNHRNRGPQKNNTSGYKGVCYDKRAKKWVAGVKLHGYRHNLGSFNSAQEAYAAYCKAAKQLHGKFAKFK